MNRHAAVLLIVALSPGHGDITRFRPWSPIEKRNYLDPAEKILIYNDLHVKNPFCPISMDVTVSLKLFEKSTVISLQENPSSGSRIFSRGQTDVQT